MRASASNAHRWLRCPGSLREENRAPPAPKKRYTTDGIIEHAVLAGALGQEDLEGLVGTVMPVIIEFDEPPVNTEVTCDHVDAVRPAYDYVMERVGGNPLHLKIEHRVKLTTASGRQLTAVADVIIETESSVEVIDYKGGYKVVPVDGNEQLLTGLAAYVAEDETRKGKEMRITIIQPKATFSGGSCVSSAPVSGDDLQLFVERVSDGLLAVEDPNAPLIPGETQCAFCNAKPCQAMESKALAECGLLFDGVMAAPDQIALEEVGSYPIGQLVKTFHALPLLRMFISSVEEELLRRGESGEELPGLKIVRGNGSRKWGISEDSLLKVLAGMGVPKANRYTQKVVSPAQAEKLKWVKKDGTKGGLTAKQRERLMGNVERSEGALTVVDDSDPRQAAVLPLTTVFSGVAIESPQQTNEMPTWLA